MEEMKLVKARIFDIDYCIEEEDLEDDMTEEEILETLPEELIVEVCCHAGDDIEGLDIFDLECMLTDQISYETGWFINWFDYEILSVEDEEE